MVTACSTQFYNKLVMIQYTHLITYITRQHTMLKNADLFYEYMAQELINGDELYESYVTNIFNGKIWGDDLMASTVSHMWNIHISFVSPELNTIHLFHDTTPKIVIMANGGNAYSCRKQTTHFSQTWSILCGYQLPGAGVAKNPKVWDDFEKGKKSHLGIFSIVKRNPHLPR